MPITEYKIVVGSSSKDLTDLLAADGLVPVGDVFPSFDGSYALQAAGSGSLDVGNATNYEVVQGDTPPELVAAVNAKIGAGKQPVGGVVPWHNAFIQVVGVVSASGGGSSSVAWADVTGKPAVIAAGADAAAARTAIGAVALGTTATTAKAGNYAPPVATAATSGTVRLSTDTVQTVDPVAATATASRSYMVQALASGQLVVNVPWVNTTYTLPAAATGAIGGVRIGAAVPDAIEGGELATINALLAALRASGALTA